MVFEIPAANASWQWIGNDSRSCHLAWQFLRQGDPHQFRFADAAALGLDRKAALELLGEIHADPQHALTVPYVGSRGYDLLWGTALRATTISHRLLDRISGGRLMRRFPGGAQVVWITTLGRKSGQWRRTPLLGVRVDEGWGIAGSNAGQERVPGWVFNVQAHAEGTIEVDGDVRECTFRQVSGDEARDIYSRLGDSWSSYRMYERNIQREIPVFVAQVMGTTTS